MGKKITDDHIATWRAELREGYTLEAVAARHGAPADRSPACRLGGGRPAPAAGQ